MTSGVGKGANVSRWGERDSRFHGNDGLGRRDDGEEGRGPFDVPQGERNPVPPGSPFERLRASGSRFPPVHPSISLRANGSQAPRFALREPQGERNPVPPSAQAQGRPFESLRASLRAEHRPFESLRASGTRFPPFTLRAGSGQALREPQGEALRSLRAGPSRASGQALRPQGRPFEQPQGRPFESLRAGPSRAPALREPQGRPFEFLRAGPSRAFTLRQAQGRPFESLRANGTRFPPVHPSSRLRATGSGRAVAGSPRSPFARLKTGPSRASGRTVAGSPFENESLRANGTRFPPVHPSAGSGQALRAEHGSPRFTLRQAQGRPFESLMANGTRLPPADPSAGSGRPFESLRANGTRLSPDPSAGSGQALREPRAEHGSPRSPFGRLRPGPSRASGRTEHGSPRLTLRQAQAREASGRMEHGFPGSPFGGSGQALREPQGER